MVTLSLQFESEVDPPWTVPTMCLSGRIGYVQAYMQQVTSTPVLIEEGGQFINIRVEPSTGLDLSYPSMNSSTGRLCSCGSAGV